jgi:CO/xanthine dehydrogenase FAD-binding subunit
VNVAIEDYFQPQSLDEAVGLLAEHGPLLLVMAGGTIAMPLINDGISHPKKVMGLRHTGMSTIKEADGVVSIGAATTLSQLLALKAIPLIQKAASKSASWSIRNLGTIGGNIFAPPPAGDVAAALLALEAQVKLVSAGGERIIPLSKLYTGFMTTQLGEDELLAEVLVPVPKGRTSFQKLGRKQDNTPAVVTVAAHLVMEGGSVASARLGLNAAGPHPMRALRAEAALVGSPLSVGTIEAAAAEAAAECEPFDDPIASEWYRRRMVGVQVKRALSQLVEEEA